MMARARSDPMTLNSFASAPRPFFTEPHEPPSSQYLAQPPWVRRATPKGALNDLSRAACAPPPAQCSPARHRHHARRRSDPRDGGDSRFRMVEHRVFVALRLVVLRGAVVGPMRLLLRRDIR